MSEPRNGIATGAQEPDDGELVGSARRGELAAFDELVRRYQRQATNIAFRLLNNRDDAMEVTQEAFLNSFDRLATLSRADRFGPWLLRIVNNLALNRRRSRALRRTASLDVGWDEDDERGDMNQPDRRTVAPPDEVTGQEAKQVIAQAVAELPEMQRQALILFSIQNLPQKQVARTLGCSVEAVKWHVFTARKKLKDKLKDYL